jgi:ADP-ribosyl-[dinitrogen reductase] hydrolase
MEIAGDEIRAMLRSGHDLLIHCRGGLGRAGMTGARLLIELNMEPTAAITQVRAVRPGAVETSEQEKYFLGIGSTMR